MLSSPLWLFCLLLLFIGCRRGSSTAPDASGKPIDVASAITGCQNIQECDQQCSSGQPAACVSAGRLYEYGRGVVADPARAYGLYDRACALGYAGGCYNAALLLEAGRGISRDTSRARELYAKVCQMGSNTACDRAQALGHDGGP